MVNFGRSSTISRLTFNTIFFAKRNWTTFRTHCCKIGMYLANFKTMLEVQDAAPVIGMKYLITIEKHYKIADNQMFRINMLDLLTRRSRVRTEKSIGARAVPWFPSR
jgi:hypothetical protein